jgi:hypothetical protein
VPEVDHRDPIHGATLDRPKLIAVSAIHQTFGWVIAGFCGVVGLWGLVMVKRETVPRPFFWAVGVAIVGMMLQVIIGVWLMSVNGVDPGNQHVFYGIVISVTFVFAYIYRAQFRRRPALSYGLLLLFVMGLGMRGITAFGGSF